MDVKVFDYILFKMEKNLNDLLEHSERTAVLCYATARELQLEPQYSEIAYMAGLLHEVGKIYLPNDIQLRDEFIENEKLYPYFSASIINCFEGFENVAKVVMQNAENIDGSGYPKGLKGDEIGIIARILRISDYYDECRSKGLTHDETTKLLRENSDVIFPKKIITPFIKGIIKNELQFEYN